jgi:hypothetical protein
MQESSEVVEQRDPPIDCASFAALSSCLSQQHLVPHQAAAGQHSTEKSIYKNVCISSMKSK